MKRRTFLKSTASAIGLAGVAGQAARSYAGGPNEDVRLAFVGLQRRGPQLIRLFRQVPGVRITALCDCDTEFLDRETKKLHDEGVVVRKYVGYRRLMEDKGIDAVVLAPGCKFPQPADHPGLQASGGLPESIARGGARPQRRLVRRENDRLCVPSP